MDELNKNATRFGIHLSSHQVEQFQIYQKLLQDWNERINLTAIRDDLGIQRKHFLDSLSCYQGFIGLPVQRIIDIGTGAGFPGLPLKIVFPTIDLVLVESIGKKADFCKLVVKELGLKGIEVLQKRAEELGVMPSYREKFDLAIARAVARQSTLMEYLLPLVKIGGIAIAQKGHGAHQETMQAESAIKILGGSLNKIIDIELPGLADERYLVVVDKIAATPENYPRRIGVATKRPL
jgi:16S rRNA (guanine527-N7)-methyltransferase